MINEAKNAVTELIDVAGLHENDLLVIGCSTSEILGDKIGTNSSPETAENIFRAIYDVLNEKHIYLAAQCCEHLNRCLIIEKEVALKNGYPVVNAVPMPKAGGSFGTAAYKYFKEPVAVEHIKADAGMDIGETLIGMHLKEVAVPVRIKTKHIGSANVICARTRPKFIGGERAHYDENLK